MRKGGVGRGAWQVGRVFKAEVVGAPAYRILDWNEPGVYENAYIL